MRNADRKVIHVHSNQLLEQFITSIKCLLIKYVLHDVFYYPMKFFFSLQDDLMSDNDNEEEEEEEVTQI